MAETSHSGNGNGSGNGEELKSKILLVLRQHPEGMTVIDIAEITGAHRQTVAKYILVLEALGVIFRRRLGSATLHYLREALDEKAKEREVLEKIRKRF
jgi:DNA-binding IclR family transcriptional regulator